MKLKMLLKIAVMFAVTIVLVFINSEAFSQAAPKPKGKQWDAPAEYLKMKNPIVITDSTLIEGKEIYNMQCKSCHGSKGKGDGTKAEKIDILCTDFTSADYAKVTVGDAFYKTTEGRKPMPSFKEKLSDTERWTVIYYVRSLGKTK